MLDGIHFFITGAAGKLRTEHPQHFDDARTQGWAAEAHFLLVEVEHDQALVTPIGGCEKRGAGRPIEIRSPKGDPVPAPSSSTTVGVKTAESRPDPAGRVGNESE